jgi:hypothetical protein
MRGVGLVGGHARHVDQHPAARRSQLPDEGAADVRHCGHIDGDLAPQPFRIRLVEGAEAGEPGVVDHAGDGQAELPQLLGQRLPGVAGGQVHRQYVHLDPVTSAQLGGQLLQPLLAAGDQHQVGAPGGELAGELGAEACAGTGDQGGLAVVVDRCPDPLPLAVTAYLAVNAK